MKEPTPMTLYRRAEREHPTDTIARRGRYLALLREHGHLIHRLPDDPPGPGLPCGYNPKAVP